MICRVDHFTLPFKSKKKRAEAMVGCGQSCKKQKIKLYSAMRCDEDHDPPAALEVNRVRFQVQRTLLFKLGINCIGL